MIQGTPQNKTTSTIAAAIGLDKRQILEYGGSAL